MAVETSVAIGQIFLGVNDEHTGIGWNQSYRSDAV